MTNDTNTTDTLSRNEFLAFTLPVLPLAAIGVVSNTIIVYSYVRFATLRTEGGVHMMALLAVFDLLSNVASLQASFLMLLSSKYTFSSRYIAFGNCTQRRLRQFSFALRLAVFGRI